VTVSHPASATAEAALDALDALDEVDRAGLVVEMCSLDVGTLGAMARPKPERIKHRKEVRKEETVRLRVMTEQKLTLTEAATRAGIPGHSAGSSNPGTPSLPLGRTP